MGRKRTRPAQSFHKSESHHAKSDLMAPVYSRLTPFQLFCKENGFTEKTVFISYGDIGSQELKPFYFLFDSDTGDDCVCLRRILESGKIADNVVLYPLEDLAIRNFSPKISKNPNKVEFIDVKFKQKGWDIYNNLFCYRWSEDSPVKIYKLVSSGSLESMIDETYLQLDPETGLFCQTPCDPNYTKFFDVYTLPSSSPSAFDYVCEENGWDPNGVFYTSAGDRLVVQWDTGYNLIFFRKVDEAGNPLNEVYNYSALGCSVILTQFKQEEEVMPYSEPKATSLGLGKEETTGTVSCQSVLEYEPNPNGLTPFQLFCKENGFTEKTVFATYIITGNPEVKPSFFLFDSDTGGDSIYVRPILKSGAVDQAVLCPLNRLAVRTFSPHINDKLSRVQTIDSQFKEMGWDIFNDLFCYRWSEDSAVGIFKLVSSGDGDPQSREEYKQLDPDTGLFHVVRNSIEYSKFYDVYHLPRSSPSVFDTFCASNGWDPNGIFTDSSGYRLVVQWDTGYNLIFFRRVDDAGDPLDEVYECSVPSILIQQEKVMSSPEPKATGPEKGEIPRKVKVDLSTVPVEVKGEPFAEGVLHGLLEGHRTPYLVEVEGLLIGFEKVQEVGLTALQLRDLLRENPNMVWSYDKVKASNSWFSDINMHQCWLCYNYTGSEDDVWEKA